MSDDWLLGLKNEEEIQLMVKHLQQGIFLAAYHAGRSYLKNLIFRVRDVLPTAKGRSYLFGAIKFGAILFWGQNLPHKSIISIMKTHPSMISILRTGDWKDLENVFDQGPFPEFCTTLNSTCIDNTKPFLSPFASFITGIPGKSTTTGWLKNFSQKYQELLCSDYETVIAKQTQTRKKDRIIDLIGSAYPADRLIKNILYHFNSTRSIEICEDDSFGKRKGKIGGSWLAYSATLNGRFEQYSVVAFYSFQRNQIIKTVVSPQGEEESYLKEFFESFRPEILGVYLDSMHFVAIQRAYETYPNCVVSRGKRQEGSPYPIGPFDSWEPCYQRALLGSSFETLEAATQAVARLQRCFYLFDLNTGWQLG